MKWFLLVFLCASTALPLQWAVVGGDSDKPVYTGRVIASLNKTIGEISVEIFESNKIPYTGTILGIRSILGTPIGDDALIVQSETKMRAYGWCFTIDGVLPDTLVDQTYLQSADSTLVWYYAFSQYDNGKWVSFCTPAYSHPL